MRQGHLKPGVLVGLQAMLRTSKPNEFMQSATSRLYLAANANNSRSSGGRQSEQEIGKENVYSADRSAAAPAECIGSVSGASAATAAGPGQAATAVTGAAAGVNASAPAPETWILVAQQSPEGDGQITQVADSSSRRWWQHSLKRYKQLKQLYEQQRRQRPMQAAQQQEQQPGLSVSMTAPAVTSGAAGEGPDCDVESRQQQSPARPAISAFCDSQATIKYVTQQ